MADYLIKGETLTGIADAIRSKTGSSAPVAVSSMASQIAGIEAGGGGSSDVTIIDSVDITLDFSHGNQVISAGTGYAVKKAIINKPATMIPENIAQGVEIAGIVGTHAGGGGGSAAGCVTVTFKNGNTTLFSRPVYIGDDCPDPIAQGRFATPTKASTAQYSYTYYGWGASDGGAADANILKNITADKTVYAIYTAAVKSYTITYYDEDGTTVLKTETLAYGTMPTYKPYKSEHLFAGWTPSLAAVTGNASYTADFEPGYSFAESSWEDIARVAEAGQASNYFAVGETREHATYGTLMILDFDKDDLADGTGKAGITIGMTGMLKTATTSTINYVSKKSTVSSTSDLYPYVKSITLRYPKNGVQYAESSGKALTAFSPAQLGYSATGDPNSSYAAYSQGKYSRKPTNATFDDVYVLYGTDASGNCYVVQANNSQLLTKAGSGAAWAGAKHYPRFKFCI